MYRCKECGTEYDIKPDYCDCGNDDFEIFVAPEKEEPIKKIQTPKPEQKQIQNPQPKVSANHYSYSQINRFKEFFDPVSTIIFLSCIISAILILVFVANPAPKTKTEPKKTYTTNIPSIDSYWDNTISKAPSTPEPKILQQETTKPEPEDNFLQKIIIPSKKVTQPEPIKIKTPQIPTAKTQVKVVQQPKTIQQPTKNIPQSKNIVINQPSLVQTTKNTNTQNKVQTPPNVSALTQRVQTNAQKSIINNQTKQIPSTTNKQANTTTKTPASTTKTITQSVNQMPVINTQKPINTNTSVKKTEVNQATLKQELNNYKISLRNTIGKKINFNNVVGDGNCIVSFKISSNGTLTNREFSQKSSNLTLNDAVYTAMSSTPKFTAPPSGYKNETLHLKVNFYNGNFDISLY